MSSPQPGPIQQLGRVQRLDKRVARVESVMAVVVLLSMIFVASAQALFFNIAQQGVAWAQTLLEELSWADMFLQKGTLWLAFLGASLAAHEDKHIGIDVLPKLVSPKAGAALRAFAALGAGVISLALAYVFYEACLVADEAVPFEYEVLTDAGPAHVCDVPDGASGDTARPGVLCALRSALAAVGVSVTSGGGVAQLITPIMLVVIGVRLLARGIAGGQRLVAGEIESTPSPSTSEAASEALSENEPDGLASQSDAGNTESSNTAKTVPEATTSASDTHPSVNEDEPGGVESSERDAKGVKREGE